MEGNSAVAPRRLLLLVLDGGRIIGGCFPSLVKERLGSRTVELVVFYWCLGCGTIGVGLCVGTIRLGIAVIGCIVLLMRMLIPVTTASSSPSAQKV